MQLVEAPAPAPFDPRKVPVRWSNLKQMARSPAHYLHAIQQPFEPTPAMRFGTLVHRMLLGGGDVVVYEGDRRGNAWKEFQAENDGMFIVTAKERDRGMRCADALNSHHEASMLLVGNLELELKWTNGGRHCKGTIDAAGFSWVSELKTSQCSEPEWFRRHALGMAYHAQLAWYADALTTIGRKIDVAHIAVVESSAPYVVTVLTLTPRALEEGRKLNRIWWERLMVCEASNAWPGYAQHAVPLDVAEQGVTLRLPDGEEIAA